MQFGRSESPKFRPLVEPLEQRQLLSVSALPVVHKPPSPAAASLVVPISVDVGSVSGTVSDSTGAAIAGAVVVIVPTKPSGPPTGTPIFPPVRLLVAKTDSSGKFSLPQVPVGSYTATAYKAGFNNATSSAFSVTKDTNTDVPITLTPIITGSVSGSVADPTGNGIADAIVVLQPAMTMKTGGGATGAPGSPPIPILPPGTRLVTKTDASGNYSFDSVPTGNYTATAFKPGFQKATSASFTVAQGKKTVVGPITLTAFPTPVFGSVTGLVTDSSGKPLAGAFVEISPAPAAKAGTASLGSTTLPVRPPTQVQFTTTDTNGQYTFAQVPTGSYVITADAKGYQKGTSAPFTVSQGKNTAPTVALTALPTPVFGSVAGTVTDTTGKPIASALVEISQPVQPLGGAGQGATPIIFPPGPVQFAKTDSNGKYTFDMVQTGTYVVSASAAGFQKSTSASFTVAQGSNTAPTLALTALPTPVVGSVTGKVTDSKGNALAGTVVEIESAPIPLSGSGGSTGAIIPVPPRFAMTTTTDANGQYSFAQVPTGTYVVSGFAKGYQGSTSSPFTVSQGSNTAPTLALTALPTPVVGIVTGTVTDASGKPIAGASVELLPAVQKLAPTNPIVPPIQVLFATTDTNGQYTISDVPTGSYMVSASADGYQRNTSAAFTVSQGNNTAPTVALTAVPAPVFGSVTGTVTDSAGKPIAGALVEISPPILPLGGAGQGASTPVIYPPGPVQVAKTDSNGKYTFDMVQTGTYVASAWADGFQKSTSAPFTVAQGSNTVPALVLTALPTPVFGSVTGTVTDSKGNPLAGAVVEIGPAPIPLGGSGGPTSTVIPVGPPRFVMTTTTDSNGQYSFAQVPTGTYVVSAFAKGYQESTSAPFTVLKGSNTAPTLALTVLPAPVVGTVTGAVTDTSGKPIAGASVELLPAVQKLAPTNPIVPPIRVLFATTDTNGQYTISDVPTGSYMVSASADGYQTSMSAPFMVSQGNNTAPTVALTVLPTPVFGSVTGTVTDSKGQPIAGAFVVISPAPDATGGSTLTLPPPGRIQFAKTDSNGQYTFSQVPVGSYVVTAFALGFQKTLSAAFTVAQGANTAPTLMLAAGVPFSPPLPPLV